MNRDRDKALVESRRKALGNKEYLERKRESSIWFKAGDPDQDITFYPHLIRYVQMPLDIIYGQGVYVYMSRTKALYVGMTSKGITRSASHLADKERCELMDKKGQLFFFHIPAAIRGECIEAYLIYHLRPSLNNQRPTTKLKCILDQERGFGASILQKLKIRTPHNGRFVA